MSTHHIPFPKDNLPSQKDSPRSRAAYVIAHPGHELCLIQWLKETKPVVFVLTDGSGSDGQSKLSQTTDLLAHYAVPQGNIYGRLTDAEVYQAILRGHREIFIELAAELAAVFATERFDYVASEAVEGYNPTHDLCRYITSAAIARANRVNGHRTLDYEASLINRKSSELESPQADSVWIRLDDQALEEKTKIMRAHPHLREEVSAGLDGAALGIFDTYPELADEMRSRIEDMGPDAFRVEHLRRASDEFPAMNIERPFYEKYGEILARDGRYPVAIRFREHILPIIEALREFALN
jgi:hypothetical protein